MSSATANRELVRRFLAACNAGDLDAAVALVTEDYVCEDAANPAEPVLRGRQACLERLRRIRAALPDVQKDLIDTVCEEDRVAFRIRSTGHHTGARWRGREPSGSTVTWDSFGIWWIRDGYLAAEVYLDDTGSIDACLAEVGYLLGTA